MKGCCQVSMSKFISAEGRVDEQRLDSCIGRLDINKYPEHVREKVLNQIKKCRCECHQDGVACLC